MEGRVCAGFHNYAALIDSTAHSAICTGCHDGVFFLFGAGWRWGTASPPPPSRPTKACRHGNICLMAVCLSPLLICRLLRGLFKQNDFNRASQMTSCRSRDLSEHVHRARGTFLSRVQSLAAAAHISTDSSDAISSFFKNKMLCVCNLRLHFIFPPVCGS